MTRKHLILIAQAIRENIPDLGTRRAVATAPLPALRASNERFDAEQFLCAAVGRWNHAGSVDGTIIPLTDLLTEIVRSSCVDCRLFQTIAVVNSGFLGGLSA